MLSIMMHKRVRCRHDIVGLSVARDRCFVPPHLAFARTELSFGHSHTLYEVVPAAVLRAQPHGASLGESEPGTVCLVPSQAAARHGLHDR